MFRLTLLFLWISHTVYSQSNNSKTSTQLADSLDSIGAYKESLKHRELALKRPHSDSYSKYLKAKWHYTKACIYEFTGGIENHKKARNHALKAKNLIEQIETQTKQYYFFKHQILN